MKQILLILPFLLPFSVAAQHTQNIRGTVTDQASGMPLIGASITVLDTTVFLGAVTDIDGRFVLSEVPVGRYNLLVTYVGYEESVLAGIQVGSGKEVVLEIGMEEAIAMLEQVVVTAYEKGRPLNEMAMVSARSFSVEESERFAASANDPARLALSFAGVSSQDDLGNEIIIRGNSPKGLLWRVEGVEIPNPNHFADEAGGGGSLSILSNNVLSSSDFYTGAFPAEFGNALSGVFDLNLRNGNDQKREYSFQAGVLGLDMAVEGPFAKKYNGSYLANYRYSTLGLISRMGFDTRGNSMAEFQDLNFKLNFPAGKAGRFALFGIGGLSTSIWEEKGPGYNYQARDISDIGVLGLTHNIILDQNTYVKTVISYSASRFRHQDGSMDSLNKYIVDKESQVVQATMRTTVQLNKKVGPKNHIRAGVVHSYYNFDNFLDKYKPNGVSQRKFESDGAVSFFQGYVQWKHRITSSLTLNTGMHASYFAYNGNKAVEPRLGLRWALSARHAITAGAGGHSRLEAIGTYTGMKDGEYINRDLELTKALHVVAGHEWNITKAWRLATEVYYQYLYDVPAERDGHYTLLNYNDGYITKPMENIGTGRNYGLELTIERQFARSFYILSTLSLYQSEFLSKEDASWHPTRYAGNYIGNVTAGKDFVLGRNQKGGTLSLNMRAFYAGGRRIDPINLELSQLVGEEVTDNTQPFQDRVKDYYRLDAKVAYRKNMKKLSWEIAVDGQNVTNRLNERNRYFSPKANDIKVRYQLGFLPILKFRLEF